MMKIYKPGFALVFCLLSLSGISQYITPKVLNVAGGHFRDPSYYYQFEWSIGELTMVVPLAPSDSSVLLTHGVLQPCTDFIGLSPQILIFDEGDAKLFPNPTIGKFELDFFVRTPGKMELQLTDYYGRVLETRVFRYEGCCRIERFDISKYPNGVYFVVATHYPDPFRPGGFDRVTRHSGFRVVKIPSRQN